MGLAKLNIPGAMMIRYSIHISNGGDQLVAQPVKLDVPNLFVEGPRTYLNKIYKK